MKKRIEVFVKRLFSAVQQHPAEVLLSVLFCVFGCLAYDAQYSDLRFALAYFPAFFLITYILNGFTSGTRWRFIYYLSILFFLPLIGQEYPFWTPTYMVTMVVVQLLYLVSGWKQDNDIFIRNGLRYLRSLLSALLLAGIAWLLSLSIYFSISYIFEIWGQYENRFAANTLSIAFIGILPLLFLMFNQEEEEVSVPDKLFNLLLNYILSPALLIYAGILYLYFLKITIQWALPKGAVAYIVVSFVSATFILKGCQVFLEKRYYDWFFRYASWAVLPALAMYWVGTCYRINQYGFTEDRVYLVVVGLILTTIAFLFFTRKTGRYLYAALVAIILLSAVTYIPGITATDIERISQTKRGNFPMKEDSFEQNEYISLFNSYPMDIEGYKTLEPVSLYGRKGLNGRMEGDTFYLYNEQEEILFKSDVRTLLALQMQKVGLLPTDTIPKEFEPAIFRFDLDSATYLTGEISAYRQSPDSAYRVTYMGGGYYLKKSVSLPLPNK